MNLARGLIVTPDTGLGHFRTGLEIRLQCFEFAVIRRNPVFRLFRHLASFVCAIGLEFVLLFGFFRKPLATIKGESHKDGQK